MIIIGLRKHRSHAILINLTYFLKYCRCLLRLHLIRLRTIEQIRKQLLCSHILEIVYEFDFPSISLLDLRLLIGIFISFAYL